MRADQTLVERGLAASRSQAQRLLAAGVRWRMSDAAPWQQVKKNSEDIPQAAQIELLDAREAAFVSRGGLKLQHAQLQDTRLVPFRQIVSRLQRNVTQTAAATGKRVRLDIEGEATMMDAGVLEQLTEPLLHLLRNAVDHGIEPPAEVEDALGQLRELGLDGSDRLLGILARTQDDHAAGDLALAIEFGDTAPHLRSGLQRGHVAQAGQVRPGLVAEVAYSDVQRSARYPGGVALRLARVVRYRDDKAPAEATSIDELRRALPRAPEAVSREKKRGTPPSAQLSLFGPRGDEAPE